MIDIQNFDLAFLYRLLGFLSGSVDCLTGNGGNKLYDRYFFFFFPVETKIMLLLW